MSKVVQAYNWKEAIYITIKDDGSYLSNFNVRKFMKIYNSHNERQLNPLRTQDIVDAHFYIGVKTRELLQKLGWDVTKTWMG